MFHAYGILPIPMYPWKKKCEISVKFILTGYFSEISGLSIVSLEFLDKETHFFPVWPSHEGEVIWNHGVLLLYIYSFS